MPSGTGSWVCFNRSAIAEAPSFGFVLHHAPQPRLWIALGRIDRDRADLDRPETEPRECADRGAAFVEAGG
jgi:hypothetical protein